jgi:hypothetical protein
MAENPVGKKGYTGNPNGRPKKGTALTDLLRLKMEKPISDFPGAPTVKDVITTKLIEMANNGDIAAMKYLMDRVDGTPTQIVEQDINAEVGIINVGTPKFLKEDTEQ